MPNKSSKIAIQISDETRILENLATMYTTWWGKKSPTTEIICLTLHFANWFATSFTICGDQEKEKSKLLARFRICWSQMSYFWTSFSNLGTHDEITTVESSSNNKLERFKALAYNKPSKRAKIFASITSPSLAGLDP